MVVAGRAPDAAMATCWCGSVVFGLPPTVTGTLLRPVTSGSACQLARAPGSRTGFIVSSGAPVMLASMGPSCWHPSEGQAQRLPVKPAGLFALGRGGSGRGRSAAR